jgi:hypothetical protein
MITFKLHFQPFNYTRSIVPDDCAIPQIGDYVWIKEYCNEIIDADGLDNTKETHKWLGKYFIVEDLYWESIEDGILNVFLCPPERHDIMRSKAQKTREQWVLNTEEVKV